LLTPKTEVSYSQKEELQGMLEEILPEVHDAPSCKMQRISNSCRVKVVHACQAAQLQPNRTVRAGQRACQQGVHLSDHIAAWWLKLHKPVVMIEIAEGSHAKLPWHLQRSLLEMQSFPTCCVIWGHWDQVLLGRVVVRPKITEGHKGAYQQA
jgi:hypothetical protein